MRTFYLPLLLLILQGTYVDLKISSSSSNGHRQQPSVWYVRHQRSPDPEILTEDETVKVQRGDTARLRCEVEGLGDFVLMWKQNSRVISAGNLLVRKDSRFQLEIEEGISNLLIRGVDRSDSGEYICEVDIMGRAIRVRQTLDVLVPPVVKARETEIELYKGQNYTLSCSGQGYPNPQIVWTRKAGYLENVGNQGLSLSLINVTRHEAGTYTCSAVNGVRAPATADINVRIKYGPEVEIEQTWRMDFTSTELEIDCIVFANPPAQVTWFKDSGKIFETDRVLMTEKPGRWTIKIVNLRDTDFGNYSCRASNILGKSRAFTFLSGRPRPPKFTSPSLNFHPHSYNLTWRTEAFAPVTEYKLRYRQSKEHSKHEGGIWSELVLPVAQPSISQHYTLRNLKTGSVYDVVGFAKNQYGWSDHSKTFTFFNKGVDFSTEQIKQKLAEESNQNKIKAEEKQVKIKEEKVVQLVRSRASCIENSFINFLTTLALVITRL